ncbi:MAG: ribonuclease G [Niameybacter sp.]|uniref:hypothetical protein n=1 Tax=Niameybacter sp. TaxID=2033640 RepID=UPI002FC608EA
MNCPICHAKLHGENFCPNCGQAITYEGIKPTYQYANGIPIEIKKWNWGAFMFNIWWGVGNKTYLPLLCLIPYFNFVWIFFCGFKGNEWAWKSGNYRGPQDIEKFLMIQKTWNRGGIGQFIFSLVGTVLFLILYTFLIVALFNFEIY